MLPTEHSPVLNEVASAQQVVGIPRRDPGAALAGRLTERASRVPAETIRRILDGLRRMV